MKAMKSGTAAFTSSGHIPQTVRLVRASLTEVIKKKVSTSREDS